MADRHKKRTENVSGNFFVDTTCIDCGTCYWVAPETFKRSGEMSHVYHQPENGANELKSAYRALFSCPTNSIGVEKRDALFKEVLRDFPHHLGDDVYHCGFHAESSFGAASYFIKGNSENFLIDSPRYTPPLAKQFREMGGVHWQLLTHEDDVADTDRYWQDFQGTRVIHEDDTNNSTSLYEKVLRGEEERQLTDELLMIPVPGHTKGSVCYLYKEKFLFTGDHLAFSPSLGHLYAFKRACWFDFQRQIKSMEKLLSYPFEYVLPGHGFPHKETRKNMKKSLEECLQWMKSVA